MRKDKTKWGLWLLSLNVASCQIIDLWQTRVKFQYIFSKSFFCNSKKKKKSQTGSLSVNVCVRMLLIFISKSMPISMSMSMSISVYIHSGHLLQLHTWLVLSGLGLAALHTSTWTWVECKSTEKAVLQSAWKGSYWVLIDALPHSFLLHAQAWDGIFPAWVSLQASRLVVKCTSEFLWALLLLLMIQQHLGWVLLYLFSSSLIVIERSRILFYYRKINLY